MAFHHIAHVQSFEKFVKKGVRIRRGDLICKVGKTGTKYAHCHYEVTYQKPDTWTQYTAPGGRVLTKEQVMARYADPNKWIDKTKNIPCKYGNLNGYEYLDVIYPRTGQLHPGVDINDGAGDQDMGNPIYSPCDGEVVYIGLDEGGWGSHIWIKEDEQTRFGEIDAAFALSVAGRIFLSVEERGEAWYVDPSGKRHYMGGTPTEMLEFVQKIADGISKENLNKIPKA